MDQLIQSLYDCLYRLLGLHRQLLESIRLEKDALIEANVKSVQDAVAAKEKHIEAIKKTEMERHRLIHELGRRWNRDETTLTISEISVLIQGSQLKMADQLRSVMNALNVLITRITEQNRYNRTLVEKALEHIGNMKRNVLGETVPKSTTYTPQGQRSGGMQGARLLSKEV